MDNQGGDMRKLLTGLVLLLLAAALIPSLALANPQRDNSNGPHKDYLWGTGTVGLPTPFGTISANVGADATTAPNGHDGVSGTFFTDFPVTPLGPISFSGDVTCINAVRLTGERNGENGGSSAANWAGTVTQSNTGLVPPGAGVLARTVDNGDGPPDDPPDRNVGFLVPPKSPCPQAPFATAPITAGDLGVHDGGYTTPNDP
jgi:hypothetical protein